MDGKRVAVVVSYPAHLLTVAGMLQRWQPDVLAIFRADDRGEQDSAARAAIEVLGLADRFTNFEVSETESFDRALVGDFAFHAAIGDRLFAWLRVVRPDVVLGDAFEAYNYHHDVTRLLLDDAVQRCRARGRPVENYEFPLSCRVNEPGAPVRYGAFPFGPFRTLRLDAREVAVKRKLTAAGAGLEVEQYREVPADRDYTAPPPGLALYYDERGTEVVTAGLYPQAITFRDHFVPLVRALGLAPFAKAAA